MNTRIIQDVNFPEFTSSLIQGVFETIQNNHLVQIKSYSDLLKATSESISDFASNNYLNVPDESVAEFLARPLELVDSTSSPTYLTIDEWIQIGLPDLEVTSLDSLNEVLAYESAVPIANTTTIDLVMTAVRKKIASENHFSLVEMVKMGMQRVVTDEILIKTRLTFKATDRSFDTANSSTAAYGSKGFNIGGRLSFRTKKFGAFLSGGYSNVRTTVNTSNHSRTNSSNTNVNLLGYVKIKAHTDYQPLSA